jgi:hypothetical protein
MVKHRVKWMPVGPKEAPAPSQKQGESKSVRGSGKETLKGALEAVLRQQCGLRLAQSEEN